MMHTCIFLFILLFFGKSTLEQSIYDESRIVGGQPTAIEQHPYQVSLRYNNRHICGGSIISHEWVLTAAHCVERAFPGSVSIKAGVTNLSSTRGTVVHVKEIITHNSYSSRTSDYDIAVIKLEKSLHFNSRIKSIELPTGDGEYTSGTPATVTGWGALKSDGPSTNHLRQVDVPLISRSECSELYAGRLISSRMLCAGYVNIGGKDSCQGDSGGPLVQYGRLIGIVSWGFGCAQASYPGVYTHVTALRSWITDETGI